jgi:hypothetical protein
MSMYIHICLYICLYKLYVYICVEGEGEELVLKTALSGIYFFHGGLLDYSVVV